MPISKFQATSWQATDLKSLKLEVSFSLCKINIERKQLWELPSKSGTERKNNKNES